MQVCFLHWRSFFVSSFYGGMVKHIFVMERVENALAIPIHQAKILAPQREYDLGFNFIVFTEDEFKSLKKISCPSAVLVEVPLLHFCWNKVIQPRFASWDRDSDGEVRI